MKQIYILLIIGLLAFNTVYSQNGLRSINWIHGFVGDGDSFKAYDEYFSQEYNIVTSRVDYPSKKGIAHCASIAKDQLVAEGENPIAVAHSMGGIVTRQMIEMGADIEGYICFGSPHQGAYFANSYSKGDVNAYTAELVDEVFVDIFQAILTPMSSALYDKVFQIFGMENPYMIGNLVFRFIKYFIMQKTDDITIEDLEVDGDYLNNLSEPSMPKVDFYGIEDSPVHWRFLGNFINGSDASDDILVQKMEKLNQIYETVYALSLATSSTCLSFPVVLFPGCSMLGYYASNLAIQLEQALMTLDKSEASWLALIGALGGSHEACYTDLYTTGYDYNGDGIFNFIDKKIRDSCLLAKLNSFPTDSIVIELDIACDPHKINEGKSPVRPDPCRDFKELMEERTYCFDIPVVLANDGFIVNHSTREDNADAWIEIRNLNHQQLKNHVKSKQLLDKLFQGMLAGELSIIDFFRLENYN